MVARTLSKPSLTTPFCFVFRSHAKQSGGRRHIVFQRKIVQITQPWKRGVDGKSKTTLATKSSTTPALEVKLEPVETVVNFEEVMLDGKQSKALSSPAKRTGNMVVFLCTACKIYFPIKHMLEQHHETVHAKGARMKTEPGDDGYEQKMKNVKTKTALRSVVKENDDDDDDDDDDKDKIFYGGYHKIKSGKYVCDYCPFESYVRPSLLSHVARKHSSFVRIETDALEVEEQQDNKKKLVVINTTSDESAATPKVEEGDEDLWPVEVIEEDDEFDVKKFDVKTNSSGDNKLRVCPYCSFTTSINSTFHSHVKRKHRDSWLKSVAQKVAALQPTKSDTKFVCRNCSFTTCSRNLMQAHIQSEHKRNNNGGDDEEDNDGGIVEIEGEIDINDEMKDEVLEDRDKVGRVSHKCPFCPFESWITSTMQSHVTRRHRNHSSKTKRRLGAKRSSAQLYTGYACHFCTFVAATVASIHSHTAREHLNEKQPIKEVPVTEYDCDQCDYKSRNRRNMQLHVKNCHTMQANADGMFTCHVCLYETTSRMGLQRHISIKHNRPRRDAAAAKSYKEYYNCVECDFKCPNRKTMEWHKRQHNAPPNAEDDGNSYFCNDCDFSTWTKGQLYLHIRRKHRDADGSSKETAEQSKIERSFACDQCDYTTKNKHVMKVHVIRKHTNVYSHECDICGKKYKVKADLTNHIRFQHREQPIICDVCGKTCRNSNLLYLHQKFAHYKPEFECPICHRRMVSQANLDDHIIKQHEKREDVVCEECGKTFTRQARLKIHMRIHTGLKPYTCKVCLKAFARRNGLRQHLLIHTGQRPYICDICGKSFTQKTGLISHRKSHPGSHPPLPRVTIDHVLSDLLNEDS